MTRKKEESSDKGEWALLIYVAGEMLSSRAAINNLREICEKHLKKRYRIKVIDLTKHPQMAAEDQIFAVPTVVRCCRPL